MVLPSVGAGPNVTGFPIYRYIPNNYIPLFVKQRSKGQAIIFRLNARDIFFLVRQALKMLHTFNIEVQIVEVTEFQ